MWINLTKLLERKEFPFNAEFPTDGSYLATSKDRTSQEQPYAFELKEE